MTSQTHVNVLQDDTELLRLAQRFDKQALTLIHERYYPEVYRLALYRLQDAELAEDIAGEVMLSLLEALKKNNGPKSSVRGWLIRVTANHIAYHFRRRKRFSSVPIDESLPVSDMEHSQLQDIALQTALDDITLEQQEVLALRFKEGLSIEETAVKMRKTVSAIKALQFRAVASLKRLMDLGREA